MLKHYFRTECRKKFRKEQSAKQDNKCAICDKELKLVIDHDHSNGYMRGMICSNHNAGLGLFSDNPETLRKAATYLEEHKYKVLEQDECIGFMAELLNDNGYASDRMRARIYSEKFGCTLYAATSRVQRARRRKILRESATESVTQL